MSSCCDFIILNDPCMMTFLLLDVVDICLTLFAAGDFSTHSGRAGSDRSLSYNSASDIINLLHDSQSEVSGSNTGILISSFLVVRFVAFVCLTLLPQSWNVELC